MPTFFLYLFLGTILCIMLLVVFWTLRNGISPMPTSPKVKKKLLQLLPEKFEGKIVDLGSGWGTLIFPLAKKYPASSVLGYENSPLPFLCSKLALCFFPKPNLQIVCEDFFNVSLAEADLVICYLYPGAMQKLKEKFENELRSGTLVVSHTFAIPSWTPTKVVQVDDLYKTNIYIYTIKKDDS